MSSNCKRYNSLLDWSTWLLVGVVELLCLLPLLVDDDKTMRVVIVSLALLFLAFMIVMFKGIYYVIDDNSLIIYEFFRPTVLPIDKIESIRHTKSLLSAPATSLISRIAIKFSDRKVLKSSMPLIISPERTQEFIDQLLKINPNIIVRHPSTDKKSN